MIQQWISDWIDEQEHEVVSFPNLEEAIVGVVERFGQEPLLCYDKEKVLEILIESLDGDREGAEEWFYVNTLGTWAGSGTPFFLTQAANNCDKP